MRSSALAGPIAEAERRLAELHAARNAIATNLLDLEADGAYGLLKAGDGLSGITATKARPALGRVDELWRGLQLLDDLIERADTLRGVGKLNDRHAENLLELLNGESIVLPIEAVPLAKRTLTGSSSVKPTSTAAELLDGMEEAFNELRDVVAAVDKAWRDLLPRVERATADAARLAGEMPGHRGLTAVRSKLQTLASRLADDPLGVAADVESAEGTLAALDRAAQERRQLADQVVNDLARAASDLDVIVADLHAGRDALAQTRREVANPTGIYNPIDPTIVTGERGLGPWLARLEALQSAGKVDKAYRGLQGWRALADKTAATVRQVAEANAKPARRRRELRGLMRAAQAKAGAEGRAEDKALDELARQARDALNVPCDLATAEQVVRRYLAELRRTQPTTGGTP
jgi:hypothetical protein